MNQEAPENLISRDSVRETINKLIAERDAYVIQVNQQIAAQNGAIGILEGLLAPPELKEEN